MEINDYQKRAMATLNPELAWKDVLLNSVMGLCGESGEAIDIVKKWLSQGHALDRAHLAEELGDIYRVVPCRGGHSAGDPVGGDPAKQPR